MISGQATVPEDIWVDAGFEHGDRGALERLRFVCRGRLGADTIPHPVDALPTNPNGKVLRHVLRSWEPAAARLERMPVRSAG